LRLPHADRTALHGRLGVPSRRRDLGRRRLYQRRADRSRFGSKVVVATLGCARSAWRGRKRGLKVSCKKKIRPDPSAQVRGVPVVRIGAAGGCCPRAMLDSSRGIWFHAASFFAARSKRSPFITLTQAATKSLTNFSLASAQP